MGCYEVKETCGGNKNYASCIRFEGTLPDWSALGDCADIEETTQELYDNVTTIKEEINLSGLESDCIVLPSNKVVKNVIQSMLDYICSLETRIETNEENIATLQQQVADLQQNNCP